MRRASLFDCPSPCAAVSKFAPGFPESFRGEKNFEPRWDGTRGRDGNVHRGRRTRGEEESYLTRRPVHGRRLQAGPPSRPRRRCSMRPALWWVWWRAGYKKYIKSIEASIKELNVLKRVHEKKSTWYQPPKNSRCPVDHLLLLAIRGERDGDLSLIYYFYEKYPRSRLNFLTDPSSACMLQLTCSKKDLEG